jgi:hypothetical protein
MVKNNNRYDSSLKIRLYKQDKNAGGSAFFVVIGVLSLLAIIVTFLFYATRSRMAVTGIHEE